MRTNGRLADSCFLCVTMDLRVKDIKGLDPYLSRRKNIVEVLQKGFIFDFIVSEDKGDAFAISPGRFIQHFQVLHEITYVVCSEKTNIEM